MQLNNYQFGIIILLFTFGCKESTQQADISSKRHQPVALSSVSKDTILHQKENAIFSQGNANDLIEFAEFLARSSFSLTDKKALTQWAIADFKSSPKKSAKFYKVLSDKLIKDIRRQASDTTFKTRLFISFVTNFPDGERPQNHILKIIDHYNPPIKEALQLRAVEHNLLMQQAQRTQTHVNQALKSAQTASEKINKSLNQQADRAAITLPGGKIIKEHKDSYDVKSETGERYKVFR